MSLTKITSTVVNNISSFFTINSSTGLLNSVVPDLMPSNTTLYPSYTCRAWVNFNGTLTSPISGRASGNISSITKVGTGRFTVTFTTPLPDANYCVNINYSPDTGNGFYAAAANIFAVNLDYSVSAPTVNGFSFLTLNVGQSTFNPVYVSVSVFR
jgi:hypothetical protein